MAVAWLLLLLPPLLPGSGGEDAEVVCAGNACYSLHQARLDWGDAQERCKNNGGNLAPSRSHAETQLLLELFAAAGLREPAWIGLSRSRGQCVQPQETLRGFAWVAGGEPGNYSAWLSKPTSTCTSTRCVSLQPPSSSSDAGWSDRPCRHQLPAFLCKFIFQGMCGPLPLAGPGRVGYTTPFGVHSTHMAAAPFGTLAEADCEGGEGPVFAVCKGLLEGDGFAWHPPGLLCPLTCSDRNGGCQHHCLEVPGKPPHCACHAGFTLASDMTSCLPKDACNPNPCQGTCQTSPNGIECSCEAGYVLAPDGRHCLDVDECLSGPCEHECRNTAGSFVCLCWPGYRPTGPGGHSCHDEDECARPGVCQQLCLNVPGSFHCACQPGYQRQPGSDACEDVDECLRDPCPGRCHNLPGTFECLCPPGFISEKDGQGCRAGPIAGEESLGVPNTHTPHTTAIPQTTGTLRTMGGLHPTAAPHPTGNLQTLGIPSGATLPAPTVAGSAAGTEHSADGPRLLLYYILGSLVAILLLMAFALALLACRRRVARSDKEPAKNAADNYCWVPEQPESRGAGGERRKDHLIRRRKLMSCFLNNWEKSHDH